MTTTPTNGNGTNKIMKFIGLTVGIIAIALSIAFNIYGFVTNSQNQYSVATNSLYDAKYFSKIEGATLQEKVSNIEKTVNKAEKKLENMTETIEEIHTLLIEIKKNGNKP